MGKLSRYLSLLLVAFLVACDTSADIAAPDGIGEALFSDADLDAAPLFSEAAAAARTIALTGDAVDVSGGLTGESALARLQGLEPAALAPQVALDNGGYIAYAQKVVEGQVRYLVRVYETQQGGEADYRKEFQVYRGSRAVDSVAISADGTLITFIAQASDGNFEVYAYDRTGDTLGQERLYRLTATASDERNISMSLDGKVHAWEGVDGANGLANFSVLSIDLSAPTVSLVEFNFGDFGVFEPSLSGDGSTVAFVADFGGEDDPATNLVAIVATSGEDDAIGLYQGDIHDPSLTLTGEGIMFLLTVAASGIDVVAYDEGTGLTGLVVSSEGELYHPYVASDGFYFTYGLNGAVLASDVNVDAPEMADVDTVNIPDIDFNDDMYWAKAGFDSRYFGSTAGGSEFTRPDDGSGLSDAERTSPYDAYNFSVPLTDVYTMLSYQDFDGYLLLYEGGFDPNDPEQNLIAENDDFGGGFSPNNDPAGFSRIFTILEAGQRYTLVTTACGDPDAGCGPDAGRFVNVINRGGEEPLPPVDLPEPDNSRYDITLVFAQDETTESLTDEQRQVFVDAAERWSTIITDDLADIEGYSIGQSEILPGTPPVQGTLDDVVIYVRFGDLGGPLGRAGPRLIRNEGDEDEFLTVAGLMEFEIAEFGEGGFFADEQQYQDVIVHEMGHVIGIGTLWELTGNTEGILSDPVTGPPGLPNPDYDPRFIGEGATEEYQTLLEDAGREIENSVPIANTGGPGNYNGHWREFVFDNELMTPYAAGAELLSRMTAASLGDIGYVVDVGSEVVDEAYELPSILPAAFVQVEPNEVVYEEFVDFVKFLGSVGEVTATVEAVDLALDDPTTSTSGCEATDFDGFTSGNIALLQRGTCPFVTKVDNAVAAGAVGIIMFNQGDSNDPSRTGLFRPSTGDNAIPAVATTFALGQDLAQLVANGELVVQIDTPVEVDDDISPTSIGGALVKPSFAEDVLQPIGTIGPDGRVRYFK